MASTKRKEDTALKTRGHTHAWTREHPERAHVSIDSAPFRHHSHGIECRIFKKIPCTGPLLLAQNPTPNKSQHVAWDVLVLTRRVTDRTVASDGYAVAEHLPGPLQDVGPGLTYNSKVDVLKELADAGVRGLSHLKWAELQQRYAGGSSTSNVVIPVISFNRENSPGPQLTNLVLLSHPDDCGRIARNHVKKMPDQALFLGDGVLSTTDNSSWRKQRAHFIEAFLPRASLQKLFPINLKRSLQANDMLAKLATESVDGVVDMAEFLLNETMAQLQLSLFGLPEEFVEQTNIPLRRAFDAVTESTGITSGGDGRFLNTKAIVKHATYAAGWLGEFIDHAEEDKVGITELNAESNALPIHGPLSARIADGNHAIPNAATFVFAGHDTTANTMSWLLFEVAQKPSLQARLQAEVDAAVRSSGGDPSRVGYDDIKTKLPFMGRCILETLRKWPVVPNGTFRELQTDDEVIGPGGKPVRLPAGTYVQITNWMRHRSTELWGPTAGEFDPDREFTDTELALVSMSGYNPASPRFSPFTYGPRDCMGRNFAQMEMRLILLQLFSHFQFELGGSTARYDPGTFFGVNRGTMGPQDLSADTNGPPRLALQLQVTRRFPAPKAHL